MSNPNRPIATDTAPSWIRYALWTVVGLWLCYQIPSTTTTAAGADSSGYLNSGRLFAAGQTMMPLRIPVELGQDFEAVHFLPLGFWPARVPGLAVPTYPPGMPLHFAVAELLVGGDAGILSVIVAEAVAALLLIYLCGREMGISPLLAVTATAILACSPMFQFGSVQPLSDTPATTWCLLTVWLALRARRGGQGWSVATGASLAMAVLIRPTNILLLPCIAILLGNWRRWLATGLGGLPGALWLGWLNNHLYGSPWVFGYGNIFAIMEAVWFFPTLVHFLHWLAILLPTVLLPLALVPLWRWRQHGRNLLALGAWGLAFVLFYAFYSVSHEVWWCLRFILPVFPALILAAMLGIETLVTKLPAMTARKVIASAAVVLLVWALCLPVFWNRSLGVSGIRGGESAYRVALAWAEQHLPPDSVLATLPASGTAYYYGHFPVLRWDTMSAEQYRKYAAALRRGQRPIYAMLFPGEENEALHERMPDQWEKIAVVANIAFWKLRTAP